MVSKNIPWSSVLRWLACALGLGFGYYLLAQLGLKLAVPPHGITVLWLPNAVVIALLLSIESRRWAPLIGIIVVTSILMNHVDTKSLLINLGYCAANISEIALGAYVLRRFCGSTVGLRKMREVVYLVTLVALLVPAVSATVAALTAVSGIQGASFLPAWRTWLVGDAMGILLLTPFVLSWIPRPGERFDLAAIPRKAEALVLFALLVLVSKLVFGSSDGAGQERIPMMYLVFPFVLWAAVRFGPRGASAASLVVATFAVVEASLGHGPKFLGSEDAPSAVYWIQIYLVVVILSGLVLAAVWSERADATAALKESEERLARTEALALVMTTRIGLDGGWLKVPPTLCKRLWYTEDILLSKTLADVVHPGDFDALWQSCRGLLEGNAESCEAEVRLLRSRKKHIWVDISLSPVKDSNGRPLYFLAHLRDITERKRAEELLRTEKEHTARIVSTAPAIICEQAQDGTVVSVNPAILAVTGYTPDEIVGKRFWELFFPGELSAEGETALAALERDPGAGCETVLRAKDGSERTVAWSAASRVGSEGRPVEMLLIGSDVTARKHAEQELHRTLEELESRVQARTGELVSANQSLAIEISERKRIGEALRRAHDELEVRVLQRTQELTRTNEVLASEIDERRRAEAIISHQAEQILELSTPIVRLRSGMELVPLIGTFDRRRAEQLMTHLLQRIEAEGSHAVLLDLTGVPRIEHDTAEHLVRTIQAVRLLGAEAVLTGVRPAIARTLVDLGVDLSGIEIQSTVAAGLNAMLRKQANRSAPRGQAR